MKPDQQSNYWQPNPDDDKKLSEQPEVHTPAPLEQEAPVVEEALNTSELPDETVQPVHWEATEYIHQEKNVSWFVIFTIVVLAFIAADIFFLKSYTFSVLVVIMAITVIIYSRRPPHPIQYSLSSAQGLYVGERLYHFSDFRSFGVIKDGEHHSILIIPTKRFALGVTIYFPEEKGEEIVDILGSRLPMEDLKLDVIDVVIRKLRL